MAKEEKEINMCRICLRSDSDDYTSLFEVYKSLSIHEHINSFARVSIIKDDGYPDKICSPCLVELDNCLNFKIKCESSNEILFNNIKTTATNNIDKVLIKKEDPDEPELDFEYVDAEDLFTNSEEIKLLPEVKKIEIDVNNSECPKCHDCGEMFKSKCKLRVHWKKTHMSKSFVCPICRRLFKTAKAYNKHINTKGGPCAEFESGISVHIEGEGVNRVFHCSQCDYKSKRMLHIRTHLVTHSGQRLYRCELCNKAYSQKGTLKTHKEGVHLKGVSALGCHICGKTFHGRTRLYKHLKTHSDESYECDICKKLIKGKKALKTHMQRHSGIKSYTCEQCAASFYTAAELCNHKRKHSVKVLSVKCDLCEYRTTTKYLLNRHMKHHVSGDKPFSCKDCGKFFATFQKLTVHERIHYEKKKYSCPLCARMFFCRRSVSKHVISKHNSKMLQNRGVSVKHELSVATE